MRGGPGVVFALLAAACSAEAQVAEVEPQCVAEQRGRALITQIHFPDGYVVEGPWHITGTRTAGSSVTAELDHIIERRPGGHPMQRTALPGPITMTFRGKTRDAVLAEAASVWCTTVLAVQPPAPPDAAYEAGHTRIM